MNELLLKTYIIISVLIALADILLSIMSIQKNKTTGRYLGFACAVAAVVDISYLISILNDSYLCMSIMSSIYFASIDIMLVCLLVFTVYFTKNDFTKPLKIITGISFYYTIFEIIIFAINPFSEIAIRYIPRDTIIARYSYEMRPLYWMHLIFSYALVALILILLIRKLFSIPRE